jgi:hypothetical protein
MYIVDTNSSKALRIFGAGKNPDTANETSPKEHIAALIEETCKTLRIPPSGFPAVRALCAHGNSKSAEVAFLNGAAYGDEELGKTLCFWNGKDGNRREAAEYETDGEERDEDHPPVSYVSGVAESVGKREGFSCLNKGSIVHKLNAAEVIICAKGRTTE